MKESDDEFVPKGAIAFFLTMIIVFAIMWAVMFFEVVGRV